MAKIRVDDLDRKVTKILSFLSFLLNNQTLKVKYLGAFFVMPYLIMPKLKNKEGMHKETI